LICVLLSLLEIEKAAATHLKGAGYCSLLYLRVILDRLALITAKDEEAAPTPT
jgi:hypothetical protein